MAILSALWLAAAQPCAAGEVAITIDNFAFAPATLTVPAGTRVVWTNRDDTAHTVTGAVEPRLFRSKPLDTGASFAVVFGHSGTYRYFCLFHAHMQGTVIVR